MLYLLILIKHIFISFYLTICNNSDSLIYQYLDLVNSGLLKIQVQLKFLIIHCRNQCIWVFSQNHTATLESESVNRMMSFQSFLGQSRLYSSVPSQLKTLKKCRDDVALSSCNCWGSPEIQSYFIKHRVEAHYGGVRLDLNVVKASGYN